MKQSSLKMTCQLTLINILMKILRMKSFVKTNRKMMAYLSVPALLLITAICKRIKSKQNIEIDSQKQTTNHKVVTDSVKTTSTMNPLNRQGQAQKQESQNPQQNARYFNQQSMFAIESAATNQWGKGIEKIVQNANGKRKLREQMMEQQKQDEFFFYLLDQYSHSIDKKQRKQNRIICKKQFNQSLCYSSERLDQNTV